MVSVTLFRRIDENKMLREDIGLWLDRALKMDLGPSLIG
jgi:hypothetical protein